MFDGKGPVEAHFDETDFFAGGVEMGDGFFGNFRAGAHDNDHAIGIRRADVIEQMILPTDHLREFVHRLLDDGGAGRIEGIGGFARLEEDVGILGRAADDGTIGRERAGAMGADQVVVDHGAHVVGGKLFDLGHFVRGAEAVEEVQEGHARLQAWRPAR